MTEIITNPTENDVLCGRGGATNNHVGNKRFRSIVSENQAVYIRAKKKDKSVIARAVVNAVRKRGGRFLKKVDEKGNGWIEVEDKKAIEKSSQALREGLDVRSIDIKDETKISQKSQAVSVLPSTYGSKKRQRIDPHQQYQADHLEERDICLGIEGLPTNYIDSFDKDPHQIHSKTHHDVSEMILTQTMTSSSPNIITDWNKDESQKSIFDSKPSNAVDCDDIVAV